MEALGGYNDSLRVVFVVALCMACLAAPGAFSMEWHTVKKKGPPKNPSAEQAAEKMLGQGESSEKKTSEKYPKARAEAMAANTAEKGAYDVRDAAAVGSTVNSDVAHTTPKSKGKTA